MLPSAGSLPWSSAATDLSPSPGLLGHIIRASLTSLTWVRADPMHRWDMQHLYLSICMHHLHSSFSCQMETPWGQSPTVLVCSGCYDEIHGLCSLNNKHLFLAVWEAGRSNIKASADLVSHEDTPPSSQMAVFVLCPHRAEGVRELSGVSV